MQCVDGGELGTSETESYLVGRAKYCHLLPLENPFKPSLIQFFFKFNSLEYVMTKNLDCNI